MILILLFFLGWFLLVLMSRKRNKVDRLFVVLFPYMGSLMLALRDSIATKEGNYQPLFLEERKSLQEGVMIPQKESKFHQAVSFEEILRFGDHIAIRRALLALGEGSTQSIASLLRMARKHPDTEVVHYATTLIAERSRQADYILLEADRVKKSGFESLDSLKTYCSDLQEVLVEEKVAPQVIDMVRQDLCQAQELLYQREETLVNGLALAESYRLTGHREKAKHLLNDLLLRYGPSFDLLSKKVQVGVESKDAASVREGLKQLRDNMIYIPKHSRPVFETWEGMMGDGHE